MHLQTNDIPRKFFQCVPFLLAIQFAVSLCLKWPYRPNSYLNAITDLEEKKKKTAK